MKQASPSPTFQGKWGREQDATTRNPLLHLIPPAPPHPPLLVWTRPALGCQTEIQFPSLYLGIVTDLASVGIPQPTLFLWTLQDGFPKREPAALPGSSSNWELPEINCFPSAQLIHTKISSYVNI